MECDQIPIIAGGNQRRNPVVECGGGPEAGARGAEGRGAESAPRRCSLTSEPTPPPTHFWTIRAGNRKCTATNRPDSRAKKSMGGAKMNLSTTEDERKKTHTHNRTCSVECAEANREEIGTPPRARTDGQRKARRGGALKQGAETRKRVDSVVCSMCSGPHCLQFT